jgi:hypothetical protein
VNGRVQPRAPWSEDVDQVAFGIAQHGRTARFVERLIRPQKLDAVLRQRGGGRGQVVGFEHHGLVAQHVQMIRRRRAIDPLRIGMRTRHQFDAHPRRLDHRVVRADRIEMPAFGHDEAEYFFIPRDRVVQIAGGERHVVDAQSADGRGGHGMCRHEIDSFTLAMMAEVSRCARSCGALAVMPLRVAHAALMRIFRNPVVMAFWRDVRG